MSQSYFDHNQNLQINGDVTFVSGGGSTCDNSNFIHVSQRVQVAKAQSRVINQGFKLLCDNSAPSARYGSGESFTGPRCHPGTRIAVQDYIFKWLNDPDGQIAMWMNGPVGIGKSAIAQTVAHLAAERGQLSSAFFFFRSDDTRNSAKYLVPTLAYEMTQQMPHTLNSVCQTITANPLLFSSPLDRQISSTLLQPLRTPFASSPQRRMLLVIDGVDECLNTNMQQAIIRSFILSFLRVAGETIPHKILIVSRPELHISSAISAADINPHVKYLALESWNTEDDIGIFLHSKLENIRQTHPLRHYLPRVWPNSASFRSLRQRSVGSFAYASVAIRYLASLNGNPESARIPGIKFTALTVPEILILVLNHGGRIPNFCQELEQIILMGQRALGAVPSSYMTPRDYIFRFFYGDKCYIDNEDQMALGNQKLSDIIMNPDQTCSDKVLFYSMITRKTDRYIRRAHKEQEFAYISEDVEALYRAASPIYLSDWEREDLQEYYAVEEL